MHQPVGSSPYSPESSSQSNSPTCSYSSGNSPINTYIGNSPISHGSRSGRMPPFLTILNQPQAKFRFRYASEMTGTHGCLMAESKERNKKEYIRVQLEGCEEKEAIIRCTLVTNTSNPDPHVHRLGGEGNASSGTEGEYQEIVVSASKNEWTATFSGLTIIHTAKRQVKEVVERRLMNEMGNVPRNRNQEQQLKDQADKLANTMDLHSVKLKFEAFIERNGRRERVGHPEYSQAIHNLKSTHAGDLRIVRIDKVYSCCTGQEEIFIFVEKVNKKDIKIRFFETDENDPSHEVWNAFADFSELDVHHQYAIAFKTPPYQDQNIQADVNVYFQLFRPSNQSTSEPKSFTYTPRERIKRRREMFTMKSNSDFYPSKYAENNSNQSFSRDNSSNSSATVLPHIGFSGENNGPHDNGILHFNHNLLTCNQEESVSLQSSFQSGIPTSEHLNPTIPSSIFPSCNAPFISFRPEVSHGIDTSVTPPIELEYISISDIDFDFEPVDDEGFLLPQFLKPDDYGSDASVSNSEGLSAHLKRLTTSKNSVKERTSGNAKQLASSGLTVSSLMSTYSMNMARAIRWYAMTGNLSHIIMRMRHLMAIQSNDGDNALHDALLHNQINVIRTLLHAASYHGVEFDFINVQNNACLAPLHISVIKNQTEATALLLQNGANPNIANSNGDTPLHLAAMDRHLVDCLQLLLNTSGRKTIYALNLDVRNYAGLTPLHLAVNALNVKGVEMLLAKGANVNIHESKRGRTALHIAVKKQSKEIVMLLLHSDFLNVNIQSYDGNTPLHLASMDGHHEILDMLLKFGADPTIENCIVDSSSDCEEHDEWDDVILPPDRISKQQDPFDFTKSNSILPNVSRDDIKPVTLIQQSYCTQDGSYSKVLGCNTFLDSGIDLMASKELPKELDEQIIEKLAFILDSSDKKWGKLADSLDLLSSLRSVLDKQTSPTTYLLSNMELWEVSTQLVLEKLRLLQLEDAAKCLEEYLSN